MPHHTSDTRILDYEPLLAPAALLQELPLGQARATTIEQGRADVRAVLDMADDRLLVVVGPCSVHDPAAAMDYARQLAELRRSLDDELLIVMRVYFEKPRTVTGWKGLINDPGLNGSYDVHRGLRTARKLLLDVVELGLPVGCESLNPVTPQYIADAVAWGAIGARTTESQVHRQLASGLSMPVGFNAARRGASRWRSTPCPAAAAQHTFFGVTQASGRRRGHHRPEQRMPHHPARRPLRAQLLPRGCVGRPGTRSPGPSCPRPDGRRQPRQQ